MISETRVLWVILLLAGCASDDAVTSDAGDTPMNDAGDPPMNDAGNPPPMTSAENCFEELTLPESGFIEIQRFKSEDGAVRVWRARQPGDRSAVGETFPYDLVRAWIETEDEPGTCLIGPSALTYTFAHHNWAEEWTLTTERAKYTGHETYSNGPADPAEWGWTDTLEAQDESGATLFMVNLVDDGCETIPYDLNACMLRMRVDEPPPGWGEE